MFTFPKWLSGRERFNVIGRAGKKTRIRASASAVLLIIYKFSHASRQSMIRSIQTEMKVGN